MSARDEDRERSPHQMARRRESVARGSAGSRLNSAGTGADRGDVGRPHRALAVFCALALCACTVLSTFALGAVASHRSDSRASDARRHSTHRARHTRCGAHRARHRRAHRRRACRRLHHAERRHRRARGHGTRAVASDGACPDAGLIPSQLNLDRVRAAVLCLVNRVRSSGGDVPLQPNGDLHEAAQGHSADMVLGNYFEHMSPGGSSPLDRMRASGYLSGASGSWEIGENIAFGTLQEATPQAVVARWMASPGHRANILDARYRATGIGVSPRVPASLAGGQGGATYTQDFGSLGG